MHYYLHTHTFFFIHSQKRSGSCSGCGSHIISRQLTYKQVTYSKKQKLHLITEASLQSMFYHKRNIKQKSERNDTLIIHPCRKIVCIVSTPANTLYTPSSSSSICIHPFQPAIHLMSPSSRASLMRKVTSKKKRIIMMMMFEKMAKSQQKNSNLRGALSYVLRTLQ